MCRSRAKIDDAVVFSILGRARAAGFDAYVVPQAPDLPMANRREDILIMSPIGHRPTLRVRNDLARSP